MLLQAFSVRDKQNSQKKLQNKTNKKKKKKKKRKKSTFDMKANLRPFKIFIISIQFNFNLISNKVLQLVLQSLLVVRS